MKSFMQVVHEDTEYMSTVNENWEAISDQVMHGDTPSSILTVNSFSKSFYENPKIKRYIEKQNKILFKNVKKLSGNFIMDLPTGLKEEWRKMFMSTVELSTQICNVGKNVFILAGTSGIKDIFVLFYETKEDKYYKFKVEPPTKKDLK